MTWEDLLHPALRIFLSVDVQDSTAFKQQADEADPQPWRTYFAAFLRDFPGELEKRCAEIGAPDVPPWKLLGDEIVFSVPLRRLEDSAALLRAFRDTIAGYRSPLPKARKLRLKGSAWTAGFPVANASIPTGPGPGQPLDYIGPSMDTGFRLGKVATPRQLAISVELAWLLLQLPSNFRARLPLYFEGRCQLKGVMEREGYPEIWTDVFHEAKPLLVAAEDKLQPLPVVKAAALRQFCELYIRNHGEPRWTPFIPGEFDRRTAEEKRRYKAELGRVHGETQLLWPELVMAAEAAKPTTRIRAQTSTLQRLNQSINEALRPRPHPVPRTRAELRRKRRDTK